MTSTMLPSLDPFAGGGDMGERMRRYDWSRTPLGAPHAWPQSLKAAVRILLTSKFAMWMAWGPELTFFCNDAYLPTVGLKRDWVLGARSDVVWSEIWPDIGPRIARVLQTAEATWDEALLLYLERSGFSEETYHTFSYSPLADDDGMTVGMLCVVAEVTDRIIGERQLAMLRDLGTRLANATSRPAVMRALEETVAADPRDLPFLIGYLIETHEGPVRRAALTGLNARSAPGAPLNGADPWSLAEILADGRTRVVPLPADIGEDFTLAFWQVPPHQALVAPMAGAEGERPLGFLVAGLNPHRRLDDRYRGFINLLTGQVAAAVARADAFERERARAEALAELDRAKTTFFANISHEFRTPLTLMLNPVEELRAQTAAEAPERTLIDLVHRNALRLLKLVNALLDFSRIEAGRVRPNFKPLDLSAYTADLASSFRSIIEQAGLTLDIDAPPLPMPVVVDPEMWEKVVLNLLSNAFKFTFEGRICVRVRPHHDLSSVSVIVEDTGTGVPSEELPLLFDRFHRVAGARGRSIEGSGIGLALVHELVRLHGGTIVARSIVDEGTSFEINLPFGAAHLPGELTAPTNAVPIARRAEAFVTEARRWLPDQVEQPAETVLDRGLVVPAVPSERGRIYLVDDNADMRAYIERLLKNAGFEVESFGDGAVALEAARAVPPDLVLSDAMMPGLDGFGLLAALRRDPVTHGLPIILLSARAGEEARVDALHAGADEYMVKPFNARELVASVSAAVRLASLRRASVRRGEGQRRILEMIATARTPEEILDAIARYVEAEEPDSIANVLVFAPDGQRFLRSRGPSLPETFHAAVDGLPIELPFSSVRAEPSVGYEPLSVEDVEADRTYAPHWRDLLLRHDLRSARLTPIVDEAGRVIASLAVYYRTVRDPQPADGTVVDTATHLASIALMRIRSERAINEGGARLARLNAELQTVLDTVPVGVWFTYDPQANHVRGNRLAQKWSGLGPEDNLSTTPAELGPVRYRLERHNVAIEPAAHPLQRAARGEKVRDEVLELVLANGGRREIMASAVPIRDPSGAIVGAVGTGTDITAWRQAERELRQLTATLEQRVAEALAERRILADIVEGTDAFVQVVDREYRWLAINKAAAEEFTRIFGVEAVPGQSALDALRMRSTERSVLKSLWQRALGGENFSEIVVLEDRARGSRHHEMKFSALRDDGDRIIGAYQFAYDVTERVEAERRLAETQAQLHEMQKLETVGQLTGGIAHDFNNLLTPIYAALDMLHRRYAREDRTTTIINGAMQSAERARVLVGRLLAFARRQELEIRPVAVPQLVRGMVDLIDRSLGPTIEVVLELPTHLPFARIDPNQLELALLNLCINARDAMPSGGRLRISGDKAIIAEGDVPALAAGRYLRLCVIDSGIGMDATTLRRAVEPFFTTKGVGRGTGLGLSMVHGLAAQSGGALRLESVPGKGTTATLYLPVAEAEEARVAEETHEEAVRIRKLTVLLVDDEELVRMGLREMLEGMGHQVIEAASGAAAIQSLRTRPDIDLLVTDYMMPSMSGAALVAEARHLRAELPALLVTGYTGSHETTSANVPRLSKPFREAELARAIAGTLGEGNVISIATRNLCDL